MSRPRRPARALKGRALVVAEGRVTEPAYVELLQQELSQRATVSAQIVRVGVGKDPLKVVKEAVKRLEAAKDEGRPFDWCCCLVDVDRHSTLQAALTLASQHGIHVIVSNLKFERWLLWHVEDRCAADTSQHLDRRAAEAGLIVGKALSSRFPIHAYERACVTARRADPGLAPGRIGPDPSSAVPYLIELMTA